MDAATSAYKTASLEDPFGQTTPYLASKAMGYLAGGGARGVTMIDRSPGYQGHLQAFR